MGRFLKPVFNRDGCHTLNGWADIASFWKSLACNVSIPARARVPTRFEVEFVRIRSISVKVCSLGMPQSLFKC